MKSKCQTFGVVKSANFFSETPCTKWNVQNIIFLKQMVDVLMYFKMFITNNTLSQVCFVSISACNQLGNDHVCAAIQLQNVPYATVRIFY